MKKRTLLKKIISFSFLLNYIIATLLLIGYVVYYAADRYESEAHFSVTREDALPDAGTGILGELTASSGSNTDAKIVMGYINSADLLLALEKEFNLFEHYSSVEKDFYFALPKDATLEDRLAFYRKHITVHDNEQTGLTELRIQTFNKELGVKVLNRVLEQSSDFINQMNQKIKREKLKFVREELVKTTAKVAEANQAILNFQNKHDMIDPNPIIAARLETINQLNLEHINMRIQIASIRKNSPESPRLRPLEEKYNILTDQIKLQREAISGKEGEKLNNQLAEFTDLKMHLEFALEMKRTTEALMEKTRVSSLAHTRYFTTIQSPFLPDGAKHPKKLKLSITIALCSLLTYSIISGLYKSMTDRM